MLPDLVILCCRCSEIHKPHALSRMSAAPDGTAPGYRCAIALDKGTGQGGFGSTLVDMETIVFRPQAGLGGAHGFLCDGCFGVLEQVGLVDLQPRPKDALVHDLFSALSGFAGTETPQENGTPFERESP